MLITYGYRIERRGIKVQRQCKIFLKNLLMVQKSNLKTYDHRAFNVAANKLWNSLPASLRSISSLIVFKNKVKTLPFKEAFKLITCLDHNGAVATQQHQIMIIVLKFIMIMDNRRDWIGNYRSCVVY